MEINLSLVLPREATTIPMTRHLCRYALKEIGVADGCTSDVELAVTEACANVVKHAGADDEFRIEVVIDEGACEIRVIDSGHGLDSDQLTSPRAAATAESGRGIELMRALVDAIHFESAPSQGTIVRLRKRLEFESPPPFLARS